MSKDKFKNESSSHSVSFGTSTTVATSEGAEDEMTIDQYLDLIAGQLEIPTREAAEALRQYAERILSALQDVRFYLSEELDELQHDLENIIVHLNGNSGDASC